MILRKGIDLTIGVVSELLYASGFIVLGLGIANIVVSGLLYQGGESAFTAFLYTVLYTTTTVLLAGFFFLLVISITLHKSKNAHGLVWQDSAVFVLVGVAVLLSYWTARQSIVGVLPLWVAVVHPAMGIGAYIFSVKQ